MTTFRLLERRRGLSAAAIAAGDAEWRRRKAQRRLLAAAWLFLFAQAAQAEQPAEGVVIWGIGQISCGRFIQERQRRVGPYGSYDATFRQWLLGFITALNWADAGRKDLLAGADAEGAMLWVENYCRARPLETFFDASLALRRELAEKAR